MERSRAIVSRIARSLSQIPGGWRLVKPLQNRFPVQLDSGLKECFVEIADYDGNLRLRLDILSYMGSCVYWYGYYSKEELMVLDRILCPEMTFVDIGANNGYFTLFAAKRLPKGCVVAFEPVKETFENLCRNVASNGFLNVLTLELGLSDGNQKEGAIYSSDDDFKDALSTLFPTGNRDQILQRIELTTLDEKVEDLGLARLDIIKIDIEGAELPALRGAKNCIERFRPTILIEINQEMYTSAGYTVGDVTSFFRMFDYDFYLIERRGKLSPVEPESLRPLCNILCRPN
ncbi:MAG: FkbM family methyltransferase [Acidobacteria bacterium]|nr:FkbM family methyltransferase [Acidobacteriota bacterium]MCW5948148.1 FkbM family methyltransferase [Pyrinomonadaceae bacterium]